ncbi:unnamed protein product [Arabis nemorensis]|uniref:Uncharacterized protein n=1 Tax=Arabis nemorensis TaxID=586526 RepID=A0A565C421_9BRAS|nr:unnamed protein product [Arabis nemorensis]
MDIDEIFACSGLTSRPPVQPSVTFTPDLQHMLFHRHTLSSPPDLSDSLDSPSLTVLISASYPRLFPPHPPTYAQLSSSSRSHKIIVNCNAHVSHLSPSSMWARFFVDDTHLLDP